MQYKVCFIRGMCYYLSDSNTLQLLFCCCCCCFPVFAILIRKVEAYLHRSGLRSNSLLLCKSYYGGVRPTYYGVSLTYYGVSPPPPPLLHSYKPTSNGRMMWSISHRAPLLLYWYPVGRPGSPGPLSKSFRLDVDSNTWPSGRQTSDEAKRR